LDEGKDQEEQKIEKYANHYKLLKKKVYNKKEGLDWGAKRKLLSVYC